MITARRLSAFAEALAAVALLVLISLPLIVSGSDRGADFCDQDTSTHDREAGAPDVRGGDAKVDSPLGASDPSPTKSEALSSYIQVLTVQLRPISDPIG